MAVSPDGRTAVSTAETDNALHWIDIASRQPTGVTPVGLRPRHAEYTKDGKSLWVSAEIGGTVQIVDTATRRVTDTIRFAIPGTSPEKILPVGIRFTPDQKTALVALGRANAVAVIDVASRTVRHIVPVGQRVWHLAISADGKRAFAANGLSDTVSVIDIPSATVTATIPVGRAPWGVAIAP